MLLHVAPLLIDPDREFLACRQWVAGRTGALGVAPDPLIRIQVGCTGHARPFIRPLSNSMNNSAFKPPSQVANQNPLLGLTAKVGGIG